VLIFDSGAGGLSFLKIINKRMPNIKYIYILDNEAFPYGNKTELFLIERSIKIINIIKKKYPITIVVIACNTVSTVALSTLRKKFNFPIIGIFPRIKAAEKITKNKIIGLIATKRTINSSYTQNIIYKKSSCNIIKVIGTNKLALIAEKKIRGLKFSKISLANIFKPWNQVQKKPDTIILGCTHFLLLKKEIKKILCTPYIYFIDSTEIPLLQIKKYFAKFNKNQIIQKNIFFYSEYNKELRELLFFLKQYDFYTIQHIIIN